MPTFCRHNRFIERCPICSKDLPGSAPSAPVRAKRPASGASKRPRAGRTARHEPMRVSREGRAEDDGFRSPLVPGIRAAADAERLAAEIAFSSGRLLALAADPPGLYGEARALLSTDRERASWVCFLIAYLGPLQDVEDPFAGIRVALAAMPGPDAPIAAEALEDPAAIPIGPRGSHDPVRAGETLSAYRQWVQRAGGAPAVASATQAAAFQGDDAWTAERRFERLFERLALPGFGRTGRYELLVTLGRLGAYELRADSLHLGGVHGSSIEDPTIVAAKRVFGIGDPLLLDRRAAALAQAVAVPVETLDLALANWAASDRATMGFPDETADDGAQKAALDALGL